MKLGIFGISTGATFGAGPTSRLAARSEELGYDSWWAPEHVVLPSPRVAPSPMQPTDPILDPLVHLAFVAAASERLLLATGIVILPQRNPVVLAKQVVSLDALSGGRFVLGIGVGYLEPELNAIGVTLAERGLLTDDHLAAMRALWYGEAPISFQGERTSFTGLDAHPRPIGRIPIVVGGRTPATYRRAVEQADGWYGFFLSPAQVAEQVGALQAAGERFTRPGELGALEISVTPNGPLTRDSIAAYREAGVHRLVVQAPAAHGEEATARFLAEQADLVLG